MLALFAISLTLKFLQDYKSFGNTGKRQLLKLDERLTLLFSIMISFYDEMCSSVMLVFSKYLWQLILFYLLGHVVEQQMI